MASSDAGTRPAPAYRRSTGSARGETRRQELLELVTDDVAEHGVVDFSLRRAARASGTTHKVLLYHFDGVDDLLRQAVDRLRERRVERGLAAAARLPTLAERVRAVWPVLNDADGWVHNQAIGLMMVDPSRYGDLGRGSTQGYLTGLVSMCPPGWTEARKLEIAHLVLATLRGLLIDRLASPTPAGADAALDALCRALDREEAAASG